jgi:hypothetical protein
VSLEAPTDERLRSQRKLDIETSVTERDESRAWIV